MHVVHCPYHPCFAYRLNCSYVRYSRVMRNFSQDQTLLIMVPTASGYRQQPLFEMFLLDAHFIDSASFLYLSHFTRPPAGTDCTKRLADRRSWQCRSRISGVSWPLPVRLRPPASKGDMLDFANFLHSHEPDGFQSEVCEAFPSGHRATKGTSKQWPGGRTRQSDVGALLRSRWKHWRIGARGGEYLCLPTPRAECSRGDDQAPPDSQLFVSPPISSTPTHV